MKFKMVIGCLADSLTVDGVEEINLTDEQRKDAMEVLLKVFREKGDLNNLLQYALEMYGDWYSDGKVCECCGDTVCEYTLEV